MERRTALKLMGAATAMAGAGLATGRASAAEKPTIALIPGLTADGFYITMHKGADAAAKAVGADLVFQGAAEWNVIAAGAGPRRDHRQQAGGDPDRADRQDPAHPAAEEGVRRRHHGRLRRYLHRQRRVPDRLRRRRLPDLLCRLRQRARRPHGGARARQGDRREGQGLCLQRQARRLDHRPARGGLQAGDEELPGHRGARDPVQRRRRQQGGGAGAGGAGPRARSRRRLRRQPVLGLAAPPTASSRRARPARSRSPASTRRSRSSAS